MKLEYSQKLVIDFLYTFLALMKLKSFRKPPIPIEISYIVIRTVKISLFTDFGISKKQYSRRRVGFIENKSVTIKSVNQMQHLITSKIEILFCNKYYAY